MSEQSAENRLATLAELLSEVEGATGEEGEWNIYFPDDGQTDKYAQVWGEAGEDGAAVVGFFAIDPHPAVGEWRCDFTPIEARELAAALLCAADAAEDRARWQTEDAVKMDGDPAP